MSVSGFVVGLLTWVGNAQVFANLLCKVLADFAVTRHSSLQIVVKVTVNRVSSALPNKLTPLPLDVTDEVASLHAVMLTLS